MKAKGYCWPDAIPVFGDVVVNMHLADLVGVVKLA
jgi:hypothetical protein